MARIACIGDSLTWGFGLSDPWRESYPAVVDLFPDARYCFDGVHPQAAGARLIAAVFSPPFWTLGQWMRRLVDRASKNDLESPFSGRTIHEMNKRWTERPTNQIMGKPCREGTIPP